VAAVCRQLHLVASVWLAVALPGEVLLGAQGRHRVGFTGRAGQRGVMGVASSGLPIYQRLMSVVVCSSFALAVQLAGSISA